jgi:uridylate kinase
VKIVISIGGSLLTKELTAENFKKYVDIFLAIKSKGHTLAVVCGGGRVCREYRDVGKRLGGNNEQLDFIGIMATHLNAATLLAGLGERGELIKWTTLKKAVKELKKKVADSAMQNKIFVGGGYDPGTSSDYDATVFAKVIGADLLINATNVDGVYSDDPKKNPAAKKFSRMTHKELVKVIKRNEQIPGEYRLFDLVAAKLIKKLKLKAIFLNGNDPQEILRAVEGRGSGTVIEE